MATIGISGFAQSGKTTVADYLEREHRFKRLHIAEPLRAMLRALLKRYCIPDAMIESYLTGDLKESVIPQLGVTSRDAQIQLGTRWGREGIHPDIWVDLWKFEAVCYPRVMNDSVRFPNEEAVCDYTILIERPGTGPAAFKGRLGRWLYRTFGLMWGVHPSERVDRLKPDFVIINDGSLEDLYLDVDAAMAQAYLKGKL